MPTEVKPLFLVHKSPADGHNCFLLAEFTAKLPNSNMLFILELACTVNSAGPAQDKTRCYNKPTTAEVMLTK